MAELSRTVTFLRLDLRCNLYGMDVPVNMFPFKACLESSCLVERFLESFCGLRGSPAFNLATFYSKYSFLPPDWITISMSQINHSRKCKNIFYTRVF